MTAEALVWQQRSLEIYGITNIQVPQVCLSKRLFDRLNREGRACSLNHGEANAIDGNTIINTEPTNGLSRPKGKYHTSAAAVQLLNSSFFFDETGKHRATSLRS
jgi:hypothetical protein